MKIGELSSASGTPVQTVRFYEQEDLLPAPRRTAGNFRIYEAPHLERLLLIRYCRGLDMSLDEIRVLLRVKDDPSAACGDVNVVLDEHIGHVSRKLKELRLLEAQLKQLRQQCGEQRSSDQCGILAGMTQAAQKPDSAARESSPLRSIHGH